MQKYIWIFFIIISFIKGDLFQNCNNCFECITMIKKNSGENCLFCINENHQLMIKPKMCDKNSILENGYFFKDHRYYKCEVNCKTCSNRFTDQQNCLTCKDNYYFIEGTTNCENKDYAEENSYIEFKEHEIIKFWTKCYNTCNKCYGKGTDINNQKCTNCISNYYKIINTDNCFNETKKNEGYYLDNNIFYPCYENCLSCYGQGTNDNHNCINCKNNYYKIFETNNCFDESKKNEGYYLDNNIFYKCHENCLTCYGAFSIIDFNCITCALNKYKIKGTNNCYGNEMNEIGYTLDNENEWVNCYVTCKTCSDVENNIEQNCINCKDGLYKIESTSNCTDSTIEEKGYYLDNEIYKQCKPPCKTCSSELDCNTCIQDYYPLEDELNKCYNGEIENYYFDENIFKHCYPLCTKCLTKGTKDNQKCILCKDNLLLNEGNCVDKCRKRQILYNNECLNECPSNLYRYKKTCVDECPINTKKNNEKRVCQLQILDNRIDADYVISIIDNEILEYVIDFSLIKQHNYTMQVFELKNIEIINKIANDSILSTVNLNDCDKFLKEYYSIPDNEDIIMIKIDIYLNNTYVNYAKYFLYDYDGNELNISLCPNIMKMNIPILNKIFFQNEEVIYFYKQGIDLFNPKIPFFNDLCFPYKSKKGTDIIIKDRRKYFFINESFCNEDCEISKVDLDNFIIICDCEGSKQKTKDKIELDFIFSLPIKQNSFLKSANTVIKCPIQALKYFSTNYGYLILLTMIFIQIILFIIYLFNGKISIIKHQIKAFLEPSPPHKLKFFDSENFDKEYKNKNENNNIKTIKIEKKISRNFNYNKQFTDYSNPSFIDVNSSGRQLHNNKKEIRNIFEYFDDNQNELNNNNKENNSIKKLSINKSGKLTISTINKKDIENENEKKIKIDINKFQLTHFPTENLDNINIKYKSFIQIYWEYLKRGHIIISAFISECFFEIRIIKFIFFLLIIGLEFTLNSLFFTEKYISEIFLNNGKITFKSYILISIFSFLVSLIFNCLLYKLTTSKYSIYKCIMTEKNNKDFKIKIDNEIKCLKMKLFFFFIIDFILIFLFWYYCSAWCAVYRNTQILWIFNSLISIIMNLLTPFILCIIPTIITYITLKTKKQFFIKIDNIINYLF